MNYSSSRVRCTRRAGAAIDMFVIFTAISLLAVWLLGNLYLTYYPQSQTASGSESANPSSSVTSKTPKSVSKAGETFGNASDNPSVGSDEDSLKYPSGQSNSNVDDSNSFVANDTSPQPKLDIESVRRDVRSEMRGELKEEYSGKIQSLNNEIAQLNQQLSAKTREQEQAVSMNGDNQFGSLAPSEIRADTARLAELENATTQMKSDISVLRNEVGQKDSRIAQLNAELESLRAKLTQTGIEVPSPDYDFRDWTSNTGGTTKMAFVRWEDGQLIFVNEKYRVFKLPLERLNAEGQAYVRTLK